MTTTASFGVAARVKRDMKQVWALPSGPPGRLVCKLANLPRGINDRIMVMQLQPTNKQKATLISAYAPTMTNPEDIIDQFYEQLDALIAAVPKSEKVIILGDFNARVGTDHRAHMVRSYWPTTYRQMQQQWPPSPTDLYCPRTRHH